MCGGRECVIRDYSGHYKTKCIKQGVYKTQKDNNSPERNIVLLQQLLDPPPFSQPKASCGCWHGGIGLVMLLD